LIEESDRQTLFEEKGGILDDAEGEPAPTLAYRIFGAVPNRLHSRCRVFGYWTASLVMSGARIEWVLGSGRVLALIVLIANSRANAFDRSTIIQQIIADSIAQYPRPCACPFNTDRAGHSCVRRSAYSKPSGYAPTCYAQDVTDELVQTWIPNH